MIKTGNKAIKDKLIGMKLTKTLVGAIDLEAESEGLTRSAVIRRILTRHYSKSRDEKLVANGH